MKLYLPRYVARRASRRPSRAADARSRRGTGETILVVEDDEAVRRSSVEALREMGYEVLEAGDAMDGVRLIVDRGGIDLLFTDVGLPGGMNGRAAGGRGAQRAAGPARAVHHRLHAQCHPAQRHAGSTACISLPNRSP